MRRAVLARFDLPVQPPIEPMLAILSRAKLRTITCRGIGFATPRGSCDGGPINRLVNARTDSCGKPSP